MSKKNLPPLEIEEQLCQVCAYIGVMPLTHHEAGCLGTMQCGSTPWVLLQHPHISKKCPVCSITWAEAIS